MKNRGDIKGLKDALFGLGGGNGGIKFNEGNLPGPDPDSDEDEERKMQINQLKSLQLPGQTPMNTEINDE